MNRRYTNFINRLLDQWIPPIIRDCRWCMKPIFYLAFKGKNIDQAMDFKSQVLDFSQQQYQEFYQGLDACGEDRPTDINPMCLQKIFTTITPAYRSVLDVGCGRGYLLDQLIVEFPHLQVHGCDIQPEKAYQKRRFSYTQARVEMLPFKDRQFDLVICAHTLEHIPNLFQAIDELVRITNKQLIIIVPRQRPYLYTFDTHINFFPYRHDIRKLFSQFRNHISCIQNDWYISINLHQDLHTKHRHQ